MGEPRKVLVQALDGAIAGNISMAAATKPTRGWLRAARKALHMTQRQMAQRLGMKQQAYASIEVREQSERVSLETLRRAAGALDCDLVYALVPKKAIAATFADLSAKYDPDLGLRKATEHSMALEGQVPRLPAPKDGPV
jgi:predicted DNA-binding mobile mystery protein A